MLKPVTHSFVIHSNLYFLRVCVDTSTSQFLVLMANSRYKVDFRFSTILHRVNLD